ncbi:MAG: ParA family protein [Candidatus Hodarchaeota archaeon]
MRIVTFHSFKGGTGKTSLAINTAAALAKEGKNIALVDFDFGAPSFQGYFRDPKEHYFSEFLLGDCPVESVFKEFNEEFNTSGKLLVALTSFDFLKRQSQKVAHLQEKDPTIVSRLIEAIKFLKGEADILFIDCMPGASYRALDSLLVSDTIIAVARPQKSEALGLEELGGNVYLQLSDTAKLFLVINQIEIRGEGNDVDKKEAENAKIQLRGLSNSLGFNFPILAEIENIPFLAERLYPLTESQDHPFLQSIEPILNEFRGLR